MNFVYQCTDFYLVPFLKKIITLLQKEIAGSKQMPQKFKCFQNDENIFKRLNQQSRLKA